MSSISARFFNFCRNEIIFAEFNFCKVFHFSPGRYLERRTQWIVQIFECRISVCKRCVWQESTADCSRRRYDAFHIWTEVRNHGMGFGTRALQKIGTW